MHELSVWPRHLARRGCGGMSAAAAWSTRDWALAMSASVTLTSMPACYTWVRIVVRCWVKASAHGRRCSMCLRLARLPALKSQVTINVRGEEGTQGGKARVVLIRGRELPNHSLLMRNGSSTATCTWHRALARWPRLSVSPWSISLVHLVRPRGCNQGHAAYG